MPEISCSRLHILVVRAAAACSVAVFLLMTLALNLVTSSSTTFTMMSSVSAVLLLALASQLDRFRSPSTPNNGCGRSPMCMEALFGTACGFAGGMTVFWVAFPPVYIILHSSHVIEDMIMFGTFSFSWIASISSMASLVLLTDKEDSSIEVACDSKV